MPAAQQTQTRNSLCSGLKHLPDQQDELLVTLCCLLPTSYLEQLGCCAGS